LPEKYAMILSLQEPVQLLIALTYKKHEMMCSSQLHQKRMYSFPENDKDVKGTDKNEHHFSVYYPAYLRRER
jgi:hypothetical protein